MRLSILILSLLFPFLSVAAQPKHEVRAAWLTALYGLDWPRTRAVSPQSIRKQKEELVDILDKLKLPISILSCFRHAHAGMCYILRLSNLSILS